LRSPRPTWPAPTPALPSRRPGTRSPSRGAATGFLPAEAELTLARTLHAAGDPAADAARKRAADLYAVKGYAGGVARAARLAPA